MASGARLVQRPVQRFLASSSPLARRLCSFSFAADLSAICVDSFLTPFRSIVVSRLSILLSLMAAFLAASGCSSGGDKWTEKLPETVSASGIALLDGEPLEGATLVFSPMAPSEHAAKSLTESGGSFSLRAFPSKSGAVPGIYQVAVSKMVEVKTDEAEAKVSFGEDEEHAERNSPAGVTWKSAIPSGYESPASSGLTITIPKEGTSSLKIELKSDL